MEDQNLPLASQGNPKRLMGSWKPYAGHPASHLHHRLGFPHLYKPGIWLSARGIWSPKGRSSVRGRLQEKDETWPKCAYTNQCFGTLYESVEERLGSHPGGRSAGNGSIRDALIQTLVSSNGLIPCLFTYTHKTCQHTEQIPISNIVILRNLSLVYVIVLMKRRHEIWT